MLLCECFSTTRPTRPCSTGDTNPQPKKTRAMLSTCALFFPKRSFISKFTWCGLKHFIDVAFDHQCLYCAVMKLSELDQCYQAKSSCETEPGSIIQVASFLLKLQISPNLSIPCRQLKLREVFDLCQKHLGFPARNEIRWKTFSLLSLPFFTQNGIDLIDFLIYFHSLP